MWTTPAWEFQEVGFGRAVLEAATISVKSQQIRKCCCYWSCYAGLLWGQLGCRIKNRLLSLLQAPPSHLQVRAGRDQMTGRASGA